MASAIINILSYLIIVLVGYLFKKAKIFNSDHSEFLSKVILYITLPSVIITSFQTVSISGGYVTALVAGFLFNIIMVGVSILLAGRSKDKQDGIMYELFLPSQNIGIFGAPIVSSCFPPSVSAAFFLFDIGNATVMFGPSFIAASMLADGRRATLRSILRALFSSPAFDCYILVFLLPLLGLKMPSPILTLAEICGAGNGFLAMLFFGIMLEPSIDKASARIIPRILGLRLLIGAFAAIVIWTLLPLSTEIRIGMTLCLAMPTATAAAAYAPSLGCSRAQISGLSTASLVMSAILAIIIAVIFA